MKKIINHTLLLFLLFVSKAPFAADTYISGKLVDITSVQQGLLIRIEGYQVPTTCPNPHNWGWMLIPEENKTMISVALAMWTQGKTTATIYTSGTKSGYCQVVQYDPHH